MKTPCVKLYGEIVKILPDSRFTVKCESLQKNLLCYLTGKLKRGPKPTEGDEVKFEIDPNHTDLGRITDVRNLRK